MEFEKLTEVDIKTIWPNERKDFSKWLSKKENIQLLGDEICLTLSNIEIEVPVGMFRCDLVAKDEITNTKVIVESQLTPTDHDHLGKIITYASGLDAGVIIWIVKEAKEEHRSAIQWLNQKTNKEIAFFLVEIHAYKIGNSTPAPKFLVLEKPNGFVRIAQMNKHQVEKFKFLKKLDEYNTLKNKPLDIKIRNMYKDVWFDVPLKCNGAHITILANNKNRIKIIVYIDKNKPLYEYLSLIEAIQKLQLNSPKNDKKESSNVFYHVIDKDFTNPNNREQIFKQIVNKTLEIKEIFETYIAFWENQNVLRSPSPKPKSFRFFRKNKRFKEK